MYVRYYGVRFAFVRRGRVVSIVVTARAYTTTTTLYGGSTSERDKRRLVNQRGRARAGPVSIGAGSRTTRVVPRPTADADSAAAAAAAATIEELFGGSEELSCPHFGFSSEIYGLVRT